ncbi:Rieske 2Fe-2S domain-containing protein [Rhodoferax sediminis]|uniref:Rieske domain-containing protein n=1 Tax=Rhodoferax sediminis TaxID=2509614 RepID=A0A515DBH1_9BURK|nr:Rieske 2Fe-2S domain-containing protein [Rhodoferax sediminis]QDL37768.1 hypothetical protein EUB48_11165 [Rhodoferax sediminis]
MQQDEQITLIRRALSLIDTHGSERGEPAVSPIGRYLDPARYAREVERIFRQHPLALCPSASLAQPGDSLALDVAGLPLLLVRGEGGQINGFVNACRHRGTRLQPPGVTSQRAFVCPQNSVLRTMNLSPD